MKRLLPIFILYLLFPFKIHAAQLLEPRSTAVNTIETFSFMYNGSEFPVDESTLQAWERPTQFIMTTAMKVPGFSLSQLVDAYIGGQKNSTVDKKLLQYNPGAVYQYIKTLSAGIDKEPQEPKLVIENNRATDFAPAADGVRVDVYQTTINTLTALEQNSTSTTLTVSTTSPATSLRQTNSLGINELISEGTSSFKGSPHNRRFNIKIGVQKEQGVLIAPGEEYSFNKNLGPVEAAEGFLPELVIKKEGTIPELGGGLCQVSSTTFRAAMAAGLPITQRRNHAYAVSYYSPQGTDATIYPGVIDLKFVNNTPGTILVWPYFKDENTLIFDFYGTKDSRQVTLEKPITFDRKADGSMKATWTRNITMNGTTTTDVFKSNYASPALYHKTETFVSATGTAAGLLQIPTH